MSNESTDIHPVDRPGIKETQTISADINDDYTETRDDSVPSGNDYRDYRESTHSVTSKIAYLIGVKKGLFEKWRETMNQLNEAGLLYIHYPVLLIQILILNTVKMLSFYAIPGFILMSSTGFIEGTLLMAVAFVSATIIPSPSGVGALEFAFVSFFGAFVQQADAITSVLVYRFATWIMPCIIGMILFVVDGFRLKRGKNA